MRKELHKALSDGIPEVQKRVFPIIMPQDMKRNSITYQFISNYDITGITCIEPVDTTYQVQIDVFAKTYAESVDIMEKVKAVLRSTFVTSQMFSVDSYANITVKYRQIITVNLKLKPTYTPQSDNSPHWVDENGNGWVDENGKWWHYENDDVWHDKNGNMWYDENNNEWRIV